MSRVTDTAPADSPHRLHRVVGFWGLTFVSLGSIIGSGLVAGLFYGRAGIAGGGGSLITWVLAAYHAR